MPNGATYSNGAIGTTQSPWLIQSFVTFGNVENTFDLDP
jgi:hypothetical protein